ncbi:AraC family transcriptional regulator [Piscinibacter sp. HJYY11]|uniref:AraC family transcriptional regulator n=1 Tax=Piscinibacter sp. HJYY11 TaxID=2801333 RepID=UPI00191EA0C1|nr:AraC family transcriptional regulator [Piscinibacter sp. HJYY11]MBL0730982.1 AraC family transcriptional regulator [Piscinibacter sp. HJYY11]
MAASELHRCEVKTTPWPGVHLTQIESSRHFPRHWHDTFGVGLIDQGAHCSASGRGTVTAHAGNLISTNPGEVHDGRPLGAPARRWRMVYMETSALQASTLAAGDTLPQGLALTHPVFDDPLLRQALQHLFAQLLTHTATPDALACDEAWAQVCGRLLAQHANRAPRPQRQASPALDRVRDRLADDLADAPSLDDLATLAGLSRYQVLRHFAHEHGMPPHAWLRQRRVEHARALIARGDALADVALACGFADQSHMSRAFTQQLGFTPGAWQRAALQ